MFIFDTFILIQLDTILAFFSPRSEINISVLLIMCKNNIRCKIVRYATILVLVAKLSSVLKKGKE